MTRPTNVAALLLAAGRSSRHPGPSKLYRPVEGKPLALHAAQSIAAFAPGVLVAVCSPNTKDLAPDLEALGFEIAWNDDPGQGLSSSLAIGVRAAQRHNIDAVLICLADMPFVSPRHLQAIADRLDVDAGIDMVGSRAKDSKAITPPAIFAGRAIDPLLDLTGDQGARTMLQRAAIVAAPSAELADFDDPDDFAKLGRSTAP